MYPGNRTAGFTVIELLIASSIFLVILGALGGIFVSSQQGYSANREVSVAMGNVRAAIQSLQYDLSMTGYRGVDATSGPKDELSAPLQIQLGACGTAEEGCLITSLATSYYEDRFTDGSTDLKQVSYYVADGGLFRKEGSQAAAQVAEGIEELRLMKYQRRAGSTASAAGTAPDDLAGLSLRITFRQGRSLSTEDFSVSFLNAPLASL